MICIIFSIEYKTESLNIKFVLVPEDMLEHSSQWLISDE